jgi:glycosyltransferase involved in cell wall biosynthesis
MANALIYSPGFDGHRQVYAFVMANVLKELGFKIYIAGNTKQIITNSFYIDKLKDSHEITIIDTSNYAQGGLDISPEEFVELQDICKTDLTIFAFADHHISLFISQMFSKKNRFRGRIVGIFMQPFHYYQKSGLYDKLRYLKNLPMRWRNDDKLFYNLFLKLFSLIDVALCIDEKFVDYHQRFVWLPDVFQQYAELIVKDEKSEQRIWIEKLNEFKERNKDKFCFFYFGTEQFRRGYDLLLKLCEEKDGCFIHCGLRDNKVQYSFDTNHLRSALDKNGRLFETNLYIADPSTIEYFFKSVSHLVLPYRNYCGSSGIMLQALEYGIPVMAPDIGIIGHRIKKYGLGLAYDVKNASSLKSQFDYFKELNPKTLENNIKRYMKYQTTEQLKVVLYNAFTGNKKPVRVP